MSVIQPLASEQLHATCDPSRLEWENSSLIALPRNGKNFYNPFQPRLMQALDLALQIKDPGYNVFLAGDPDLDRTRTLLTYLEAKAARMESAPDLVYVYNFDNPDSPSLLSLPSGFGRKFKSLVQDLIKNIKSDLEKLLNTQSYQEKRAKILEKFNSNRTSIMSSMSSIASKNGFSLDFDNDGGIELLPSQENEQKNIYIKDSEKDIKSRNKRSAVTCNLLNHVQNLNKLEECCQQGERELEKRALEEVLNKLFPVLEKKVSQKISSTALNSYLASLKKDILQNCPYFLPPNNPHQNGEKHPGFTETEFSRYSVNIFVDNSEKSGAPIIVEENPAICNLLGCIERESELGTLITDFTLIRSGSLHKANGGFLILHIEDLLQHPLSWEALLRALRLSLAKIDDINELPDSTFHTKSLKPEPLKLNVKVILIGSADILEELLLYEERFAKLFRIKTSMNDQVIRNSANIRLYLFQIANIIKEASLLPFDKSALAWLIDLGSHLCEDQKRLSLKFPLIKNYMIEAAALAQRRNIPMVSSQLLEEAYSAKDFRENLVEEIFMEEYNRQMIKLETDGTAIGQVNGLSVTISGDYEFGLPHRISCSVGVGHDGIMDLEREADLGGPIHTKAMLILKGYLTKMFARRKPLVLNASLYFEQSYAEIEGDSASGAELVALLSALADVPVRLDLALTGALGNSGQIMAVGGVTRKIEGFYKVCSRKGLTGTQGVIIPFDNKDHLMLSPEILDSVEKKQFFIYAVHNIEEALKLLTGMNAGKPHKDGHFTRGSLFDLVDRRLEHLGCYAQNSFRKPRRD